MHSARALLSALELIHGPQHWWPADEPFEVILGALLVQRTAWRNAAKAIERLREGGVLSIEAIASTSGSDLETMVVPAGFFRVKARRLKAMADFVVGAGGIASLARQPTRALRARLLELDGVGPETADSILLYAFERPVWVSDAYSRRLLPRLDSSIDSDDRERHFMHELIQKRDVASLNELHALIVIHGQRVCGRKPRCADCDLRDRCAFGRCV